ncbi:MAG: pyridoxal phosphate-dependent aminotransferase [Fimbriimonadaceae bacterium]
MDIRPLLSRQTSAFQSPALRQVTLEVMKVNGVNLGQGVCNLPAPPFIIEQAHRAAVDGINRYTNPRGLISLREALAKKLAYFNNVGADPNTNIMVTCGATGAFEGVCGVLLDPGDEAIVFEPSYPYHMQALKRYQANVKVIPLTAPNWEIDFDEVKGALSSKTKFILINTPGNPTGRIFSREELDRFAEILEPTDCMLVTDEIYEYMTFNGVKHLSPASIPSLKDRTITMGGYSKTFSITGWRMGYAVVPEAMSEAMASFLDAVYVCPPAPLQQAVADGINEFDDSFYAELMSKYEKKRDYFVAELTKLGLDPLCPAGAYYMICSYERAFPGISSGEFVARMIRETGVGAVPSSDFVQDHTSAQWVRFCLANEDDVLEDAILRLQSL